MTMTAVDMPALMQVPRPPSRLNAYKYIENLVDSLYAAIERGDEDTLRDLRERGQQRINEARERGELPCAAR